MPRRNDFSHEIKITKRTNHSIIDIEENAKTKPVLKNEAGKFRADAARGCSRNAIPERIREESNAPTETVYSWNKIGWL